MYAVDWRDKVVQLTEYPQCSGGAPMPIVIATDYDLQLAYIIHDRGTRWKNEVDSAGQTNIPATYWATIRFPMKISHMFGMPNDEALRGHPLWSRGVRQYGVFRVEHSSWIRKLERMNSVHRLHNKEEYHQMSHFIFSFHDTTFECVSKTCEIDGIRIGPRKQIVSDIVNGFRY